MTRLRTQLAITCSRGQKPVISFEGLLTRDEIQLLRFQGDMTIILNAKQSGRIAQINQSQAVWRNWLSHLNINIKPFIEQLIQRGNNHGT